MVREESVDKPHLIDDEEAEDETHDPGHHSHAAIKAGETAIGKLKGHRNRCGDQHHACDSANAENQKI